MSNARKISQLVVGTEVKISNVDSDIDNNLTNIISRLDSDDTKLQSLSIAAAAASGVAGIADSDLKVVADLRSQLDSEILFVRNISLSYTNYLYNATAGQTTFTGSDANSATLAYTAGSITVFLNGIKLEADDFTATDGTSIVLTQPAGVSSQLSILCPKLESNIIISYVWTNATEQADLQAASRTAQDFYGAGVAIDGGYAIVNASDEDTTASNAGSCFIYVRSGSTWSLQQQITSPVASPAGISFGNFEVDLKGSRALIGAKFDGGNASMAGAAYTFTRSGSTWSQEQRLVSSDIASVDTFGSSVALDGDYAIIGANRKNNSLGSYEGAAYIYYYNGSSWSQQAKLEASDPVAGQRFGDHVAIDGSTVVVSAPYRSSNTGKVYIFTRSGFNITSPIHDVEARMTGGGSESVNELEDPHGIAFNADGTKAFVVGTGGDTGDLVIQYSLSTAYDLNSITFDDVRFSVASQTTYPSGIFFKPDGTKMYISSSTDQASSGTHAVFQYSLSTAFDLSTASYDSVSIDIRGASEGGVNRAFSIAFKPDGTKMFIVNKPYPEAGAVFEYHLSTPWAISSFSYDSNKSISTQTNAPAGIAFNTDGTQMFINATNSYIFLYNLTTGYDVSTASYSNTSIELSTTDNNTRGITFNPTGTKLYRCGASDDRVDQFSTTSFAQQATLEASDGGNDDLFGEDVSISGDYIAVNAPGWDAASTNYQGATYIFKRTGTSWAEQAIIVPDDHSTNSRFGGSVVIEGDVLAVGDHNVDNDGVTRAGAVYTFERNGTNWIQTKKLKSSDAATEDSFGGIRGVDMDGTDMIIGAHSKDTGRGKVYIFTT